MNKTGLIIILLLIASRLSGQNYGGQAGMSQGGGHIQDPIPDSIPLIITRFYNDNINFTDSSGIDTLFGQFELIKGDENFNNAWMGNFTYPVYFTDFEKRINSGINDFYFLSNYSFFLKLPENFYYFRTNRPYTKLYYVTSVSKETEQQSIELLHTQNIDYYTNFGLEYNAVLSVEPVRKENSHISDVRAWISQDKGKYSWTFNIFLNHIKTLQNGGIVDTPDFDPKFIQYYLTKAYSINSYRGWDINPQLRVYSGKNAKAYLQFFTGYYKSQRTYVDPSPKASFYGNIYIDSTLTYDSVSYDLINNELRFKLQISKLKYSATLGQNLENFYLFKDYIYKQRGFWSNNFFVFNGFEYQQKSWQISGDATYFLTGRKKGNFSGNISMDYRHKMFDLYARASIKKEIPDYFLIHYFGNHDKWENNFVPQELATIKAGVNIPRLKTRVEATYFDISNYVYFDMGVPVQVEQNMPVYKLSLDNSLSFSIFRYKSSVAFQKTSYNDILNLPSFIVYQTLYADFYLFKKAMRLNIGYDMYWTGLFNMYTYRPSVDAFYFLPGKQTGNHPIINIFANIKVKRVFLFVKMDFINAPDIPYYSTVLHYHYPTYFMRFGAQWWFKN